MSKLKRQIKETENELALTDLYIQQQYAELSSNPKVPRLFSAVLLGGLVAGFIVGKTAKFGFKTLYKLPIKVSKYFAMARSIGMILP